MFNKSKLNALGFLFGIPLLLWASPSFAVCASLNGIAGIPSTVRIVDNFNSGITTVRYTINGELCTAFPLSLGAPSDLIISSDNASLALMLYDAKIGGRSVGVFNFSGTTIDSVATPR